jgi:hypothetical protein
MKTILPLLLALFLVATVRAGDAGPQVFVFPYSTGSNSYFVSEISLGTGKLHPCKAELGDKIEILANNLGYWMEELVEKGFIKSSGTDAKTGAQLMDEMEKKPQRFVLLINGQPMRTLLLTDFSQANDPNDPARPNEKWYSFQCSLDRDASNADSKREWMSILQTRGFAPAMEVTLGIYSDDGAKIIGCPTLITPTAAQKKSQFYFCRVMWDAWTGIGFAILGLSLILFVYLAFRTAIIRDPEQPPREDGLPPVSLGRCQMAFWFFLVAGAFFFLWLVTGRGDLDTLNGSTLALIGISAGTALGAAFIPTKVDATIPPPPNYARQIEDAKEELLAARTQTAQLDQTDAAALVSNKTRIEAAELQLATSREKLAKYRREHRNQFLLDLLSEDGVVSFHRFQIVVWTLVLGVIFASDVLTKLAMPVFDSTLLTLMGVSSGTYLGFKLNKQ